MAASPTDPAVNTPAPGCGAEWLDLLHTGEALLLVGLRRKVGPTGDLRAAYRQWYREQMVEHDHLVAQIYDRLKTAFGDQADRRPDSRSR
ncbi:MAG: hypothetical protein L0211_10725 [Planctomycetaceae bacterium]|nr:hypothetical protein [Planctomycetaceae bacterium]